MSVNRDRVVFNSPTTQTSSVVKEVHAMCAVCEVQKSDGQNAFLSQFQTRGWHEPCTKSPRCGKPDRIFRSTGRRWFESGHRIQKLRGAKDELAGNSCGTSFRTHVDARVSDEASPNKEHNVCARVTIHWWAEGFDLHRARADLQAARATWRSFRVG